ncbi:hypothetical protein AA313_de0206277 [Arthrobotrys entomopaga]|nr:hypothetical protein AA313_de0206277 [Arthrobotrys entomopaga]
MWKLELNFITLHYAYIILMGIIGFIIIYPYGNMPAVDAYFFGVSGSTESGLNTINVKDLKTYQQLVIYFIPMFTNLGFINIVVVLVRLYWFEKRFKQDINLAKYARPKTPLDLRLLGAGKDLEAQQAVASENILDMPIEETEATAAHQSTHTNPLPPRITFAPDATLPNNEPDKALHVPPPREREQGRPIEEVEGVVSDNGNETQKVISTNAASSDIYYRPTRRRRLSGSMSIERVTPFFVLGITHSQETAIRTRRKSDVSLNLNLNMPTLSSQATLGRNSNFKNLTVADREELGGMEYRALKLLFKIVVGYFFGLHLFGAIGLLPWIYNAPAKYQRYLESIGQSKAWWAFYSAQTMVDNLGFTLTPDSMISFRDATWPMLFMTFLAYSGNTWYPVMLRLIIWMIHQLSPKSSTIREPLSFLLKHPRRCYTLLFGSRPTWVLFIILFALNFVDVLLIIVLDLQNPEVNALPVGKRILAGLFQAASSRHTGTSTFNLAAVNPAVQISLLVMMYIAIYPIAISIRASNTYEETSLGIYPVDGEPDEEHGRSYLLMHMQNQLSFDLWYIFLGIFFICIAEAPKIMDQKDPAFTVFPVFFEVVSAYGNVGLSLGHPTVLTSLCGKFTPFSKLVICAMMIRGRHRGLPYALDRAIMLPSDSKAVSLKGPKEAENADAYEDNFFAVMHVFLRLYPAVDPSERVLEDCCLAVTIALSREGPAVRGGSIAVGASVAGRVSSIRVWSPMPSFTKVLSRKGMLDFHDIVGTSMIEYLYPIEGLFDEEDDAFDLVFYRRGHVFLGQ